MTELEPALVAAYLAANYRVLGAEAPFVLHVDVPSAPLAAFHAAHRVTCSALLTACNPASIPRSADVNAAAHRRLEAWLSGTGLQWVDAIGEDPAGTWAAEASVLVPGLEREAGERLARDFGQNAFVWAGADALPRLLLLR